MRIGFVEPSKPAVPTAVVRWSDGQDISYGLFLKGNKPNQRRYLPTLETGFLGLKEVFHTVM